MGNIIRLLGSLIFAGLMFSIPVLCTWSLCHGWPGIIQYILLICSIGELLALISIVYWKSFEEGE